MALPIAASPSPDRPEIPRLLFAIRYCHPWIGGLEKNTFNLARELSGRGLPVTVLTGRFFRSWPASETAGLLLIRRLPSPRIRVLGAILFLAGLAWRLLTQRDSYDIVHAFQVGHTAAVAVLLSRLLGKPSVLTLAGGGSGGDIFRHRRTPWGRMVLRACLQATRIVTLNRQMHEELAAVRCPENRAVYIPNGVDTERFHPRECTARPDDYAHKTVVYVGRLAAEKGVAFLVRAHALLQHTLAARLVIVGDGPERKRLERLTRRLGTTSLIEFTGPADDVRPYLWQANVFVLPSKHEGMPNALLEAMACGVPVIATHVPGTGEIITDRATGLLVAYNDVEGMARAIATMLTDAALSRGCAQRALACIRKQYTFAHETGRYINLYRALAKRALPSAPAQPGRDAGNP